MREETVSFDEAISGYLTRLPRSLRLLAMTIWYPRNTTSSQ
ncbi:RND transporter [Rickettsia felis]|nr:RND transporter [Rickettsia felis]